MIEGLGGDVIEDAEVGLAVREPTATSIVEAIELLVVEGSSCYCYRCYCSWKCCRYRCGCWPCELFLLSHELGASAPLAL